MVYVGSWLAHLPPPPQLQPNHLCNAHLLSIPHSFKHSHSSPAFISNWVQILIFHPYYVHSSPNACYPPPCLLEIECLSSTPTMSLQAQTLTFHPNYVPSSPSTILNHVFQPRYSLPTSTVSNQAWSLIFHLCHLELSPNALLLPPLTFTMSIWAQPLIHSLKSSLNTLLLPLLYPFEHHCSPTMSNQAPSLISHLCPLELSLNADFPPLPCPSECNHLSSTSNVSNQAQMLYSCLHHVYLSTIAYLPPLSSQIKPKHSLSTFNVFIQAQLLIFHLYPLKSSPDIHFPPLPCPFEHNCSSLTLVILN